MPEQREKEVCLAYLKTNVARLVSSSPPKTAKFCANELLKALKPEEQFTEGLHNETVQGRKIACPKGGQLSL